MSRKITAGKPAPKTPAKAPSNPAGPAITIPAGATPITVDTDQIQKLAYEISQQPKTWDELVWLFAESELRLAPAYALGNLFQPGAGPATVYLYPARIVDSPREEDIRKLAEQVAAQGPSLQDLHWFIAERAYAYNTVKAMK